MRSADALVIQSGEVPHLIHGGDRTSLTMPAPGGDTIAAILREVLSEEQRTVLAQAGKLETRYDAKGGAFAVSIDAHGQEVRMTFARGARKAEVAAPPAPAAATPDGTTVGELLAQAQELGASDVILSAG